MKMLKIFMIIDSIDKMVLVEEGLKSFEEAVYHCNLYFDKNPKLYLIKDVDGSFYPATRYF